MVRPIKKMCAFAVAVSMAFAAVSVPASASTTESKSDSRWQMTDDIVQFIEPTYDDECSILGGDQIAFVENGEFRGEVSKDTNIVFVNKDGVKTTLSNNDGSGKTLFDAIYPVISDYRTGAEVLELVKDNKITFMNFDGEYVCGKAEFYNYAEPISETAMMVSDDGVSYKIINKDGKVTVDNIKNIQTGWSGLRNANCMYIYTEDNCYAIDREGNLLRKFDERVEISYWGQGYDVIYRKSDGKTLLMDAEGNIFKEYDNNKAGFYVVWSNNYLQYTQKKQENGETVTKYFVVDVFADKVLLEAYSEPQIGGNLLLAEINKGKQSLCDVNGKVYIDDVNSYCKQFISAEGYVTSDGAEIYTEKNFVLIDDKFVISMMFGDSKAVTYVVAWSDNGTKSVINRFEGMYSGIYSDYIVTKDIEVGLYLKNIYTLDGKLVKNFDGYKYDSVYFVGVGDIIFRVISYDYEIGHRYAYVTSSGELSKDYSWVSSYGNFIIADDFDGMTYVYNLDNELLYKGKNVSCDSYGSSNSQVIVVDDYETRSVSLYDDNGNRIFSGKNIFSMNFSQFLLIVDRSGENYKYGAIRVSDNIAIEDAEVKLSNDKYTYDGKAKTPAVSSVKVDGVALAEGKDYTVSYKNNTKVGKATVIITGKGDYKGTCSTTFEIVNGNGMQKGSDGKWYYYTNGKVDTSYTGLAKNSYGWWYINKGKLDTLYTGMAKNEYGWWYVKNGKLDKSYTGMAKNEYGWWYMKNGKLDESYTGMAKNEYGWWYIKNGKLDKSYTGMAKNEYGWWYMKNGKLDKSYTGMAKNEYGWWYMKNGKLDHSYTGMAKNEYGWFYMKNGKLDLSYIGLGKNAYGTWYIKNGKLDTKFSGKVTIGGKNYTIKNGKVV